MGAGGEQPAKTSWQTRTGHDVYQLPTELFDSLGIKNSNTGKTLTAAGSRPRGGLVGREYWDMMDYAHQVAGSLTPEMRQKYGIVEGTNPYQGRNPWGYPGQGGKGPGGTAAVGNITFADVEKIMNGGPTALAEVQADRPIRNVLSDEEEDEALNTLLT